MAMKSFVYCFSVRPDGPCKIGYSADLLNRFSTAQVGNHETLTFSALMIPAPPWYSTIRAEMHIHRRLLGRHLRGEWFSVPVEEVCAMMAEYGEVIRDPSKEVIQELSKPSMADLEAAASCHPRARLRSV